MIKLRLGADSSGTHKRITPMSADMAQALWPDYERFVEMALTFEPDRYTKQDIIDHIVNMKGLPFLIEDDEEVFGFFMGYPMVSGNTQILEIRMLGSERLDEWVHIWDHIIYVAKRLGFDQLHVCGRKGWGRKLPHVKELTRVYYVDLADVSTDEIEEEGNGREERV